MHMNLLAYVTYKSHLKGIVVLGTYIAVTDLLSPDAEGTINDGFAFHLLR